MEDNNKEEKKGINREDILSLLGIKIEDGKIEIDTNATKKFFEELEKKLENNVKKLEKEIEEGKIDLKDSVGIKIDENKIEIDLNRAKNFLNELSLKIKNIVETLDSSLKNVKV